MKDISHSLILLNGQLKTLQIESITYIDFGMYRVHFKNNAKSYTYSSDKVLWLKEPIWFKPDLCKIYREGIEQKDVIELWCFSHKTKNYWRIKYRNGYEGEYSDDMVRVVTSCLDDKQAKNTFEYLKCAAKVNTLCKEDRENGILANLYEKIDYINSDTVAARYLNTEKYKNLKHECSNLIYPFGCNASQKKAVIAAFENQTSVIQGPPGTGKTQTILNIIANIVLKNKTVMVVSNNNSATTNVLEKLEKYGLGFIVAPLGKNENKKTFIENQPSLPQDISSWECSVINKQEIEKEIHSTLEQLDYIFALQNELAELQQEQQAVELEWKHFCTENTLNTSSYNYRKESSSHLMDLWLQCQSLVDMGTVESNGVFAKLTNWFEWIWMKLKCKYRLHLQQKLDKSNLYPIITELQTLYYHNKGAELTERIEQVNSEIKRYNAQSLATKLTDSSMKLFKASLYNKYKQNKRTIFKSISELLYSSNIVKEYPVILSTTFSARFCLPENYLYDYIIMDEASQVSIETGTLALTCAHNAVIVGDTMQLANVVTNDDGAKHDSIFKSFNLINGYDCAKNSFLQSVSTVMKGVPQTLLREHYRCHPRIINFCNQKFYGGNLLIMTQDKGEENILRAIKTVKGNHAIDKHNQREIDVVKQEILPTIKEYNSIGIVTPYNCQVNQFTHQIPDIETATVHKYQGREKDIIIMSVVDNKITDFADDPNLLNVAVSRAKNEFCLVVTGNEQEHHGNVMDLVDYIDYNNCSVTESNISSIFDYLYKQYTNQRIAFIKKHPQISMYASENLTYALIQEILEEDEKYNCYDVLCHIPLRQIIKNTALMSKDELEYASNYNTHVDFLIVSRVSKKPILAIETDGYTFHNKNKEQQIRDAKKNHIFELYDFPLLRLSTKGSNEKECIESTLSQLI